MVTKESIQALIDSGMLDEALTNVDILLQESPTDDALYYLKGKVLMRKGDWKKATDAYLQAQALNPDGPAQEQLSMIKDIMDFYNKDMYNHWVYACVSFLGDELLHIVFLMTRNYISITKLEYGKYHF